MAMRSVVPCLIVVLLVLGGPAAWAQEGGNTGDGDGWYGDDTSTEADDPASGPGSGNGGSNSGATGYWWWTAYVEGEGEDGCWTVRAELHDTPPPPGSTYADAMQTVEEQGNNGVLWDPCPEEEQPTFDPAAEALNYWRTVVSPPLPTAEVKPGHAMTGLPSYLEIGGEDSPSWTLDNPIGADIIITASPRYEIDWGDGSGITSTTSRGVPYPGGPGEIVHHYGVSSTYTIEVAAFWTGSWRLANEGAGAARSLPELPVPTTTDLPLEVRQVQAIRDR